MSGPHNLHVAVQNAFDVFVAAQNGLERATKLFFECRNGGGVGCVGAQAEREALAGVAAAADVLRASAGALSAVIAKVASKRDDGR